MSRKAAQAFHVGEYVREELEARGWTTRDLALRMGGTTTREVGIDQLTVEMSMAIQDLNVLFTAELDKKLARAFGVSEGFFLALDRAWREWVESQAADHRQHQGG